MEKPLIQVEGVLPETTGLLYYKNGLLEQPAVGRGKEASINQLKEDRIL